METEEQILAGGKALLEKGVARALISLGGEGAYFMEKDDVYRAKSPRVEVKSTVGAGDSMVAALACGTQLGLTDDQRLKLAVAISAASVMCTGTQAPEAETIKNLYHQVTIREVN